MCENGQPIEKVSVVDLDLYGGAHIPFCRKSNVLIENSKQNLLIGKYLSASPTFSKLVSISVD